ncbi:MAG: DUF1800 family protein [Alphaproteobacteria bacterium]|nr:DUF1800 family protein [Alphaproteobacteria bacterium]
MARNPKEAALILHRFGFGPRAGSIEAIAPDPHAALLAELDKPDAGQLTDPDLPTSGAVNRAVFEYRAARNAMRKRQRREAAQAVAMEARAKDDPAEAKRDTPAAPPKPGEIPLPRRLFLNEARARIDAALYSEIGFAERLVWFWSNHFCVNQDKTVMAGGFEREAIRPYVLGRFGDMLLAAESHPAMLIYLDNATSIGPNSVAGINRDKGLNENLAREILELHTLGVRTVYTQADVTNFAKILTGWTVLPTASDPNHGGEFVFLERAHEPGPQTLIGKTYEDAGAGQGRAVLADLARHPATARHVATKMARHFIADDPPPALVDQLTRCFLDTDGDLKEIAKALINAPESWRPGQAKIKRPGEWIAASLRATGIPGDIARLTGGMALLGEPLWRPPAPKGFPDDNAAWLDGLPQRLDIANSFAQRAGGSLDAEAIAQTALGPLASAETRDLINGAASKPQALTFVLMAPEFQRR